VQSAAAILDTKPDKSGIHFQLVHAPYCAVAREVDADAAVGQDGVHGGVVPLPDSRVHSGRTHSLASSSSARNGVENVDLMK
jgi:hypothetical protein